MNTVQNGKGDSPRNNYGPKWYAGYEAINWRRNGQRQPAPLATKGSTRDVATSGERGADKLKCSATS